MKLIVVRHGETIQNMNKIIQGQTNGQLSKKGIEQSKKLGNRLKNIKIDTVYSSDLKRATDTANNILVHHPNIRLVKDKRLRERFFGSIQGKKVPKDWDWENLPGEVETDKNLCERIKNFIDEIYPKHKNETVLIVCHGGIKRAFLTVIHNKPVSEFGNWEGLKNTSVSEFKIMENGNHQIKLINSTSHLEPESLISDRI